MCADFDASEFLGVITSTDSGRAALAKIQAPGASKQSLTWDELRAVLMMNLPPAPKNVFQQIALDSGFNLDDGDICIIPFDAYNELGRRFACGGYEIDVLLHKNCRVINFPGEMRFFLVRKPELLTPEQYRNVEALLKGLRDFKPVEWRSEVIHEMKKA